MLSLTDLSVAPAGRCRRRCARSSSIGVAVALARPSWITEQSKVSTVVLVDVSDSVSEKQLDAATQYVDELAKTIGDGNLQLVTFAEKPTGRPRARTASRCPPAIKRHVGAGAGTDTQAAMQLAYGLYPDGYLPRMVIVSDGNQTVGDVAVEAYRAKELGVKVSWRTFDQDKTSEIRVVGVTVPDEIKVGQPFEVTAEVWSTEAQTATLVAPAGRVPEPARAEQDGRAARGQEPRQVQVRRQARRRDDLQAPAREVREGHREGRTTRP